jgi:hypothetical protein
VPGVRLANFADFLWAFGHPAVYGDGEPAAHKPGVAPLSSQNSRARSTECISVRGRRSCAYVVIHLIAAST